MRLLCGIGSPVVNCVIFRIRRLAWHTFSREAGTSLTQRRAIVMRVRNRARNMFAGGVCYGEQEAEEAAEETAAVQQEAQEEVIGLAGGGSCWLSHRSTTSMGGCYEIVRKTPHSAYVTLSDPKHKRIGWEYS